MHPYLKLFGYSVPAYTILLVSGAIAAMLLAVLLCRRRGVLRDDCFYAALLALVGGLFGAKLLFLLVNFSDMLASEHILNYIKSGGLVFYGGLLGGIGVILLYCRGYKLRAADFFDTYAPCICFAHAFGRVGCFLTGCCYGMVIDTPISVYYPAGGFAPSGVPVLPTQLMEAVYLVLLGAVLTGLFVRRRNFPTCALYMLAYGVWRFVIEFFRSDPRGAFLWFSTSQWISIALVTGGVLLLKKRVEKNKEAR